MKTFPKCCEPGAPLKSSSSGRNGQADRTTCIPDPAEEHDADAIGHCPHCPMKILMLAPAIRTAPTHDLVTALDARRAAVRSRHTD